MISSKQFYCKLDAIKLGIDSSNEVLRIIGSRIECDDDYTSLKKSAIATITTCQRNLRDHIDIDPEEIQIIKNDEN